MVFLFWWVLFLINFSLLHWITNSFPYHLSSRGGEQCRWEVAGEEVPWLLLQRYHWPCISGGWALPRRRYLLLDDGHFTSCETDYFHDDWLEALLRWRLYCVGFCFACCLYAVAGYFGGWALLPGRLMLLRGGRFILHLSLVSVREYSVLIANRPTR